MTSRSASALLAFATLVSACGQAQYEITSCISVERPHPPRLADYRHLRCAPYGGHNMNLPLAKSISLADLYDDGWQLVDVIQGEGQRVIDDHFDPDETIYYLEREKR